MECTRQNECDKACMECAESRACRRSCRIDRVSINDSQPFDIGAQIVKYRRIASLNQRELAEKLGISPSRLFNWENNRHAPSVEHVAKICAALDVAPDELLNIHIKQETLSKKELAIVQNYRRKAEVRKAVDILLGVEP